ncbi:hypothetical protein ACVLV4_000765 [Rathayibacter agropyri]
MNLLNKQCAMQAGAVLAAAILLIGAASPASAATSVRVGAALLSPAEVPPAGALTREQVAQLVEELKSGPAPRSVTQVADGSRVAYHVRGGDVVVTYDSAGHPLLPGDPVGHDASIVQSKVSTGADPFPYLDLDSAEQAAGAGAAAGSVAAATCAALGPESGGVGCAVAGGIGLTIVSIMAAHGVCPGGQNFRIYLLTLEDQCRE